MNGAALGAGAEVRAAAIEHRASDGAVLHVHAWQPQAGARRGIVHVAHGLAEHGARYARLAAALCARGFAVYANDHRGHGRTAASDEELGFFAERDGFRRCVDDLAELIRRWRLEQPRLPVVLLGHSMGSYLTLHFLSQYSQLIDAAVLSGSNAGLPKGFGALRWLVRFERWRLGARGRSRLVDKLAFGNFNRPFEPARTPFDWLSRDEAEVDKYVADPRCGFAATTQLWCDLANALPALDRVEALRGVRGDLPLYVFAGDRDPINDRLRGLEVLLATLQQAGLRDVEHRFYEGGRHEMLNEINRDEVTADLGAWLERVCPAAAPPQGGDA